MADFRDGVLWRYEPGSGRLERITSNGEPRDLAALGGKVYVAADGEFLSGVVSRYDAATGVREDEHRPARLRRRVGRGRRSGPPAARSSSA